MLRVLAFVLLFPALVLADDACELQILELRMQLLTAPVEREYMELKARRDALKAKVEKAAKENAEKAKEKTETK